jgi:uncharacterized membrane protein
MWGFVRIILALAFILVIPGYLLAKIFFKKSDKPERFVLIILLSVMFSVFLGLILGFSAKIGLNSFNLWAAYSVSFVIMAIICYKK